MTEPTEQDTDEPTEPTVTDVPEPDQPGADDDEEEAEGEDQTPPDQLEETPQAQGTTPEQWEKRWKAADKAFEAYSKRVGAIFEEDAQQMTPFSISPSAPPGFVYGPDAGRVPEEIQRATFEFFGLAREQDYAEDPETRECATCKGKGKTKTGSHVAGRETRACPRCKGTGAEGLAVAGAAAPTNGASTEPFTLAELTPSDVPDADNWGEPRILPDGRENPNWGKQSQFKTLVEPWGVTANLTVQDAQAVS